MTSGDELAARLAANRFRLEREAFATSLVQLLGRSAPAPLDDAVRTAALVAEFRAAHSAAEPNEWAISRSEWSAAASTELVETLHRLARNLKNRAVWLLTGERTSQAITVESDAIFDNPLGFAAIADYELRLLDQQVAAGAWLVRHSHHFGRDNVRYTWELEVFGEPWLSAATRALRGEG